MSAHALPAVPRSVHWRAWAGRCWGLLVLGLLLLAGGATWLALAGAQWDAILAAPEVGGGDPAAAAPVGLLMLPGLVCMGLWLRAAQLTKQLLTNGRAVPAEVLFQQRVRFVRPEHVYVGYRLVPEARGAGDPAKRRGRQWIAAASAAGKCLRRGGTGLCAVYDPAQPQRSRLVAVEHFSAR